MATKYIVNNLTGQTIDGGLTISGNTSIFASPPSSITGTTGDTQGQIALDGDYLYYCSTTFSAGTSEDIWRTLKFDKTLNTTGVYRALLSQTSPILGIYLSDFGGAFIIGETYTITNYISDDDFSNIADVQSGTINQSGCVFIATGEIPNRWVNNSEIQSSGNLAVTVLENTLGYDLDWFHAPFGGYGYYVAINDSTGPFINAFPRNNVTVSIQATEPYDWGGFPAITINSKPSIFEDKDDILVVNVLDWNTSDLTNNGLYHTPIEIKINVDTTPFILTPTLNNSYPYIYPWFTLYCNGSNIGSHYTNDPTEANNASELAAILNGNSNTNFLGTFSDDGNGNIILTMTTSVKNRYCENRTLTMTIYAD